MFCLSHFGCTTIILGSPEDLFCGIAPSPYGWVKPSLWKTSKIELSNIRSLLFVLLLSDTEMLQSPIFVSEILDVTFVFSSFCSSSNVW